MNDREEKNLPKRICLNNGEDAAAAIREIKQLRRNQFTLPKTIYKYAKLDNHLYELLIRSQLWFSSPRDFNDPYDCNICLDDGRFSPERETSFRYVGKDQRYVVEVKDRSSSDIQKEVQKEVDNAAVCCFSSLNDDLLLWSHYADAHRGICIGFDTSILAQHFGRNIFLVNYDDKFPDVAFSRKVRRESVKKIITHKSKAWRYEKEVRIITDFKGYHNFDSRAIKEIILGLRVNKSQISTLLLLLNSCKYSVSDVKKVTIKNDEYRVQFDPIQTIPIVVE